VNELTSGKHPNKKLKNAWGKYGREAFVFEIVELCTSEALLSTEQRYLNELTPHYNLCPTAGSTLGLRWSPEAKNNAVKAQRLFAAENVELKARCGRNASVTHSQKLKSDPEYRENWINIRLAVMRKKSRFIQHNGVTKTLHEWATDIGIDRSTLIYRLRAWGIERALSDASLKGKAHNAAKIEYRGEVHTFTSLAKTLGINRASFCEYAERNGLNTAITHYEAKLAANAKT
jgi:group I intron endonuclease